MSTVVYHDYFAIRGGGERVALELAKGLDAQLVYGYRTADTYEPAQFPAASGDLGFKPWLYPQGLGSLALARAFAQERRNAEKYDIRIFSGVLAPFAAPAKSARGRNIYYCHTPPRFLYDQREHYLKTSPLLKRLGLRVVGPLFRARYEAAIARMDVIVANSKHVRDRIRTYLGRDSQVIYPPVDIDSFYWGPSQGYYLSTARLTPLKRVDRIVEAFLHMPDKRLIVASGGEEEARLRAMAANAPNITFTGWTSEAQLRELIAGAIATIYVPVAEDFGMSPVESMAAGKPVIGVAEGGMLETIIDGKTGVLLPPGFNAPELVRAVELLTERRASGMTRGCTACANRFAKGRFLTSANQVLFPK